ncbi:YitT family protein [Rhizobium glycinendophyticum]|uniref:YitT family protein n=1 Tax=Rhizobium glycinendophyticum TaxID=2589807 RepID=A0A504UKN3_9HYPH|nr:YitT family protein [Rhizobium glycinendophyticum]TPP05962.1 YitT family protein [Rhizobium glycinendophyticum]
MTTTTATIEATAERHRLYEDVLAMISGTMFVSLGTLVYTKTMLTVGSSAGLALLLSYTSGWGFGPIFFVVNLPFYILAVKRMGWAFTFRTFTAVALVAILSKLNGQWIDFSHLDPLYATVIGGGLIGTGLLMLFRHRTGLGGINILAMYLQEKIGLRAGYFQLAVDLSILAAAYFILPADRLALSVLGAAIANLILAINHKPGRYMGLS